MQVRQFVCLAVMLLASAFFAAAQSETTRKDQPQNQTTGSTIPAATQSQSGGTGMGTPSSTPQSDRSATPKAEERLYREVRHELVMLPNLSLWDNLAY